MYITVLNTTKTITLVAIEMLARRKYLRIFNKRIRIKRNKIVAKKNPNFGIKKIYKPTTPNTLKIIGVLSALGVPWSSSTSPLVTPIP